MDRKLRSKQGIYTKQKKTRLVATALLTLVITTASYQETPRANGVKLPMGSVEDVAYAEQLWLMMHSERLVGKNADRLKPFFGGARPHGMILELAYRNLSVGNHTGFIVIKKNYDGSDVSVANVEKNRAKYLSSITVMYQRELGYDEDNQNWFWVKYKPDGRLFKKEINGKDVALAGRILKGKTRDENGGCLYCHSSAGGGDYIFYPDIQVLPVNN
ncbi:MAG: hypothetical protein ACE5NW_08805 [Acidiferrobacterales bacterium]